MNREGKGLGREERKVGGIRTSSSKSLNVSHGSGGIRISSSEYDAGQLKRKSPSFRSANPGSNGEFGHRLRLGKRGRSENVIRPRVVSDLGNDDEYMDLNDVEIEIIDEQEFRNKRTHSMTRTSTRQKSDKCYSAAASRKIVAGNDDEYMDPNDAEIERIDEAEFRNKRTHSMPRLSTMQEPNGYMDPNDAEIEIIDEAEFRNKRTHSMPRPSTMQEPSEYMDPNDAEIERIDEAEFRNKRTHSMPRPSTMQEPSEYMDLNDVDIKRIDEAEFRNKRTHSMPRPSTMQEPSEYMDLNDVDIKRIDEAEFRNKRTHSILRPSTIQEPNEYMDPNDVDIKRIDEAEFRNKRTHSMPRPSTRQELGKGAATPGKHLAGNNDTDLCLQDFEIKRTNKAEFMKKKSCSLSKIRTTARQESNQGYPEATHKKTTNWMEKRIFCAGLSGSNLPENAGSDSNNRLHDRSSSFVKICEGMSLSLMDANRDSAQGLNNKWSPCVEKDPAWTSNLIGDCDRGRLGKRRTEIDFRPRVDGDNGYDNEYMDPTNVERIIEWEFRNKRTSSMPKALTWQELDEGYSAATSRKYFACTSDWRSSADLSRTVSPNNSRRPYKSTSFVEKGDNNIDMDLQDNEIERTSKAEFMKKKSISLSKIRISPRQESNEGYPEATHKKTANWKENKIFPAGLSGSILPENAGSDSNNWLQYKSISFVNTGNSHEDTVLHEVEVRTEKPHDISQIGPSNRQEINEGHVVAPWKKIFVRKRMSSSSYCISLSPIFSDQGQHSNWSP